MSLRFDIAVGEYLQSAAGASSLNISSEITLMCWAKFASLTPLFWRVLIDKGYSTTSENYWFLETYGTEVYFGFLDTTYRDFGTSGANLQTDTWYHLAGSFKYVDGTNNQVKVYLNGALLVDTTTPYEIQANPNGRLLISSSTYSEYSNSTLEDVRIYNSALTPAQVENIYNSRGIDSYHPTHRFMLNEGVEESSASGSNSIKNSGDNPDITLTPYNTPTYKPSMLKWRKFRNNG